VLLVAKIGTSSVTTADGLIDRQAIVKLCREIAAARSKDHKVVIVTSGAVTAGIAAMGLKQRPTDITTLQALSSVGQYKLMTVYGDALEAVGLNGGQVLLTPLDFAVRSQYLHAKKTIERLLEIGVIPIINENDAVADDELRFGDNDRLAALVANLLSADLLLLLTDTEGLFDADPKSVGTATLIEEIQASDKSFDAAAMGPSTSVGSGGMASKLAAARMASFSGIHSVISSAKRENIIIDSIEGGKVGTKVAPHRDRLTARRLWIAFGVKPKGILFVDDGAKKALTKKEASLLAVGIIKVTGDFESDDGVEIADREGKVFAKGLVRQGSQNSAEWIRKHSAELSDDLSPVIVHRDDLVIFDL